MKRGQRAVHLTQADLNLPSGVLERALDTALEFFACVGLERLHFDFLWRYGVPKAAYLETRRCW